MNLDLPGQVLRSVLLSMEATGHETKVLLRHLRNRPTWEELIGLLESFFSHHGIAATQSVMSDLATRHSAVRVVTELLGSPRISYLVLFEALNARPAPVRLTWTVAAPALHLRLELLEGLRPSQVFFQCCAWFLAALPRARGVIDARLHTQYLSERGLECLIIPPHAPELTLPHPEANVRTLAGELFGLQVAVPESSPTPALTAQTLQSRFGLTRAEARVVRRLAEGRSIKLIAEELEVSFETARTHAKRAMQKTDTHRQAELVSLVLNGER